MIEDDSAWDDLCVNPQRSALELGRQEGKEAGLESGFNDGMTVGVVKGIEFAMEVGFIRGVLREAMAALSTKPERFSDSSQLERMEKTATALSEKLDAFPSPDEVFKEGSHTTTPIDLEEGDCQEHDSEQALTSNNPSDLARKMQGIRSKFKLLTVQLRWPNYSLKSTLDAAANSKSKAQHNGPDSAAETVDW